MTTEDKMHEIKNTLHDRYKGIPKDIEQKIINSEAYTNDDIDFIDVSHKANELLYKAVMPSIRKLLNKPARTKHKVDLMETFAIRMLIHKRGLSKRIFCQNFEQFPANYRHWLISVLNKSDDDRKQYLQKFAQVVENDYKQRSKHLRIFEYIAIPAVLFTVPDIVSAFIMLVTGGFFTFVGMGAMMYANHFMTVYALPRLALSVIGDGIAYWINKKRDEEA